LRRWRDIAASDVDDLTEQRAGRDCVALFRRDFRKHACGRRVDFEGHLIGFEFGERFIRFHGVADFFEPFADGRLTYRFAKGRYADVSHYKFSQFSPASCLAL